MLIDLYVTLSPNVLKVVIALEEIGLPYRGYYVPMHIGANFDPDFLALNPIGKLPVIVDHAPGGNDQPIFESGAILVYLAETYGSSLLPATGSARWEVFKWLMVQVALAGPMLGQLNHFQLLPSEKDSYAFRRYRDQAARVYGNIDDRLAECAWLGGDAYSIADVAMYPWAAYHPRHGFSAADHPHLTAWRERIDERPAVRRAAAALQALIAADPRSQQAPTEANLKRTFAWSEPGPEIDGNGYHALGPLITAKS